MYRLAGWVTVCDEVHGFRYFDERDLIEPWTAQKTRPGGRRPRQPSSVPRTPIEPAAASALAMNVHRVG